MRQTTITCDSCGALKGEANHWWEIYISNGKLFLTRITLKIKGTEGEPLFHLCGQACVIKKVGEFLSNLP